MPLEYEAIRKSFNKAAPHYQKNAVLQKEVLRRLLERLNDEAQLDNAFSPTEILDLGCGTGWAIETLHQQFPQAQITAVDFAQNMLDQIKPQPYLKTLLHDIHQLPFADASMDVVFSNMVMHWCNESDVFSECLRLLKPGGLLIMSSLGETSLVELKQAWLAVDKSVHVHDFPALHSMGDALMQKGFQQVVVNAEIITLTYADIVALMKDIKASGGHNCLESRKKSLMVSKQLEDLKKAYEIFREDNKVPASYEIVYLRAKKATESADKRASLSLNIT